MASTSSSPCAACKFLRRKCQPECVFAPYFPPDQPQKFANVHKVFGASNVTKLLNELHPHQREDAVNSLAYEADMRLRDPVYGCVGVISLLQHQLRQLQLDLSSARSELSKFHHQSLSASSPTPFAPVHHQGGGIGNGGIGINLIGGGDGGGRDHYHYHHQFFPQQGVLRGFDTAVAGAGGYDHGGLLAMNVSTSGIGQLGHLQQSRTAGGDDRRSIEPS